MVVINRHCAAESTGHGSPLPHLVHGGPGRAGGGETWHRALGSDEWTGATDVVIDPRDPNRIYAATWDRHRTVAALMGGGPGSGIWKSEDGGESWVKVSPDLTRQLDRNTLEVMGRVWGVDTIAKNMSTSMYGSLIAVDESPVTEGLIYAGTDDGLIHVTADGGANWNDHYVSLKSKSIGSVTHC